jgi:hypothetical protein
MYGRPLGVCLLALVCAAASVATFAARGCAAEIRDFSGCRELRAARDYSEAINASRPLIDRLNSGLRAPGMTLALAVRPGTPDPPHILLPFIRG